MQSSLSDSAASLVTVSSSAHCVPVPSKDWASFLPPVGRPEGDCFWLIRWLVSCGPDEQGLHPKSSHLRVRSHVPTFITSACELWAPGASLTEPPVGLSQGFAGAWGPACGLRSRGLRSLGLSPVLPP